MPGCSVCSGSGGGSGSPHSFYFDKDSLELAFKYFSSTTLTMRLAGIAQINSHINFFNEICQNTGAAAAAAAAAATAAADSPCSGGPGSTAGLIEVESVGLELAAWILNNKIVEHIFGPSLHVEVIKQV